MATTATPTLISGVAPVGKELYEATFTLAYDTTTAAGIMTIDLTDYFSEVCSIVDGGSDAATTGYMCAFQHAGLGTATTSTNCAVCILVSAGDGDPMDSKDSTDMSSVITNQVIVVKGKQAI
jgi:hypothetical protein